MQTPQAVMPAPPAALSADCLSALLPPDPLVDPARLEWEADTVTKLEACKARHVATVKAWGDAVAARTE